MKKILFSFLLCSSLSAMYYGNGSMHGMYGTYPMGRDATGTSWIPSSTLTPEINVMVDQWMLMFYGYLNAVYDDQGGPRGGDKFFSENMFMFTAQKDYRNSIFALRSMVSLEPKTIGCNGYPLLLQTGETCNGKTPLIDRQHPHDFLMELAAVYTVRFTRESSIFAYVGYPGEPALGPPTYMHRFSAIFNPEAPITHHWLDSTHITFGVATLGFVHEWLKIDASIFTGREPNQNRWNFDPIKLDSYSGRISLNPTNNIAAQVSYGYIKSPEALEPDVNIERTTASVSYNLAFGKTSDWQITACWGRNRNHPGRSLDGYLIESAIEFYNRHVLFGRWEYVAKEGLFAPPSPKATTVYKVRKIDLGYLYEFPLIPYTLWGLGFVGSASFVPGSIKSSYGGTPYSYMVFLRVELKEPVRR